MNSMQAAASRSRIFNRAAAMLATTLFALTFASGAAAQASFSKVFAPDTIGVGSTSALTFTISAPSEATDLEFTDVLPTGLVLASPSSPTLGAGCDPATAVSAPDGGDTVTFTSPRLGAGATCTLRVDVTGNTAGSYVNTSDDLTSSAGNSGSASDMLTIDASRPGFSKQFSSDSVVPGEVIRLTFYLDASAVNDIFTLNFTDNLPTGLQVATAPDATNTCPAPPSPPYPLPTFNASPGATSISFNGYVPAETSCELSVNVEVTGLGTFNNRTANATSTAGDAGFAVDQVISGLDPIGLTKRFDDPVPPGGTTDLVFTLTNSTRDTVTGINFTDDLNATLTGLQNTGPVPLVPCGSGSSISGSSLLTFSGGTLASGESCTFSVEVTVPVGAAPGTYPNITSSVNSSAGTFSPASDDLDVGSTPILVKEFCESGAATTDPCTDVNQVEGGETILARFTVINPDPVNAVTGLTFDDDFVAFLGGVTVSPANQSGICGGGSLFSHIGTTVYRLSSGSLAAGTSCTFQVDLQLPADISPGTYVNETTPILGDFGTGQVAGNRGVDQISRSVAPRLTKTFDGPVGAGDTVDLVFTLDAGESPFDFTDIAFTDALEDTLPGLQNTGPIPLVPCGTGSSISGSSLLIFSGGTLASGESCSFSVEVTVPAGTAPGTYLNTTSEVTATADGEPVVGDTASDNLDVTFVDFQKGFLDDPVVSGGTVTLRFFIDNLGSDDLTGLTFTDDLDAVLTGLAPIDTPQSDICGIGSTLSFAGGVLTLTGGNLAVGESCGFNTVLQVPAGTAAGEYVNVTSSLSGSNSSPFSSPGATDNLLVSDPLSLAKEFTDDPAVPGGTVTLEFTVTNTSGSDTISDIAFTDDLDAVFSGLVSVSGTQNDVCGIGSQLSGTSVLTLSGAELAPGTSCTFSATLSIPASASGSALNTTSTATGTIGAVPIEGTAASDTLRINNLTFAKSFSGPSTATGTVTLSFTLENLDLGSSVIGLSFTDDLDAVIAGLVATDTPQANVCGAGSQVGGTSLLTFTGGELGPGASCTFDVELQVPASATPGSFNNTTSNLTSNGLPLSAPASAALQIEPPPAFDKEFIPSAIALGGTTTLLFTIDNSASAVAATSLAFTDNLPAGLLVASTPNASSTCTGGTLTAAAGTGTIAYSGGSVAAGAQCTLQVDIVGSAEGTFVNTTDALTSSSGDSGTATDTIDVITGDFVVIKSFSTQPVLPGGLVMMELSFVNGSGFALSNIALTDDLDAVIPGLVAGPVPADVCGGSEVTGTSTVILTGGNLPAGGSCTVVVPVRVPADAPTGTFTNTTSVATGIREGFPVEAPADSADLVVEPLAFTKSFDPSFVEAGSTTTVTYEITNPDPANAVTGLAFTDDLEAFIPGVTTNSTPINGACGAGSLVDGTSTIALTGGTLAAGGSCSFQVVLNIPADTVLGEYTSVSSDLTSSLGNNGNASAMLTVGLATGLPMLNTLWLALLTLLLAAIGWRALNTAARKQALNE